ncbi:MAG: hypothetical protein ABIQ35_10710 [Verrucomicrobiota bacterium]
MNSKQARELLELYRPGTPDTQDADFAEALELARRDPILARWLADHCARYKLIRERLKEIAVPTGLREQILGEQKSQSRVLAIPRTHWRKPVLAAAAVILALLAISGFWLQFHGRENSYSTYQNRMVGTALRNYGMDLETNNLVAVQSFLAQKKAPSDYTLPLGLKKLECTGTVVLRWQDQPVSMICFRTSRPLPSGETSDVFLFVIERGPFPGSSLQWKRVNKLLTVNWTEGNKAYLLATHGDENFLRSLL